MKKGKARAQFKRAMVSLLTAAMIASGSIGLTTITSSASVADVDLSDPLKFSVYTNTYTNSNHVEGNVAIGNLQAGLDIWEGKSYIGDLANSNASFKCNVRDAVVAFAASNSDGTTNTAVWQEGQGYKIAKAVKASGATILRGGAYKPRTSPYSFQGLEEEGLRYMQEAKAQTGLSTICEVVSLEAIEAAVKYVDMIQIGARNMQNFILLKEAGQSGLPVLLKRGLCATIDEWLNAAEYIIAEGNPNVVLCERGIRTFETATRNTLDLSAVPVLRNKTHLPVIVDPSHSTGSYKYVAPMAKAAVACDADGLMIEVHNNPACALSDGPQSLTFEKFEKLTAELRPFCGLLGRNF